MLDCRKKCERLYKIIDSVFTDPLFDYSEFIELMSMSDKERKAHINDESDGLSGSEMATYYSKIERLISESKGVINLRRRVDPPAPTKTDSNENV